MRVAGACVFIAGAASGLGRATAQLLHAAGAAVVLADRDAPALAALAVRLGERVTTAVTDVREPEQIDAAMKQAIEVFGYLHASVNCAGVACSAKVVAAGQPHDWNLWRQTIDINLSGTFYLTSLAAAHMLRNPPDHHTGERGLIINTASIAAFEGQRGQAAYAASKAGIVGLTLPAARDLAPHGIRVLAIAPGLFATPLLAGVPAKGAEALRKGLLFPARPGEPPEFALLVRHVMENGYLNGTCLRLDGGNRLS